VAGEVSGRAHHADCMEEDAAGAGRGDLIGGFHIVSSLFVPLLPKANWAKCYEEF